MASIFIGKQKTASPSPTAFWPSCVRWGYVTIAILAATASLGWGWQRWRGGTPLPPHVQADRIHIAKSQRTLSLWQKDTCLKSYRIALGWQPIGHKEREGDGKTPEGTYRISGRNAQSRFHQSLRISYPAPQDTARARARGESAGGDIMIHGLPAGLGWLRGWQAAWDWTAGCVAVSNEEIAEIWRAVPDGVLVQIDP